MNLIKICPSCNHKNSPAEYNCIDCGGDLSSVSPIDKVEKKTDKAIEAVSEDKNIESISQQTILEETCNKFADFFLIRLDDESQKINIQNNSIIGRENAGEEIFISDAHNGGTISRSHAKFTFEKDQWFIHDLNSSNGTYINNQKITPMQKYKIKNNDKIEFSSSSYSFYVNFC